MRRPIVSKSERSGTGVDMANLSKAVCHGESDKCRFGNPPQESNFQRLGITTPQSRQGTHGLYRDVAVYLRNADAILSVQQIPDHHGVPVFARRAKAIMPRSGTKATA